MTNAAPEDAQGRDTSKLDTVDSAASAADRRDHRRAGEGHRMADALGARRNGRRAQEERATSSPRTRSTACAATGWSEPRNALRSRTEVEALERLDLFELRDEWRGALRRRAEVPLGRAAPPDARLADPGRGSRRARSGDAQGACAEQVRSLPKGRTSASARRCGASGKARSQSSRRRRRVRVERARTFAACRPPRPPSPARAGTGRVLRAAAMKRCAIYTRKSSDEGLDQQFNSLDAQREACEAYVLSQAGEGWTALPARYDDGGYSGGSMERPGLQASACRYRSRAASTSSSSTRSIG